MLVSASRTVRPLGAQASPTRAAPAAASIAVSVTFTPVANLTYQLDCVAQVIGNCGAADFTALWSRRFMETAADSLMLERWRQVRERYAQTVPIAPEDTTTGTPPIYGAAPALRLDERVRMAGLRAKDRADYAAALELLVLPQDRTAMLQVIDRFLPRFSQWMRDEAVARGAGFARATRSWLTQGGRDAVQRLVRLYDAELSPADTIAFTLLYRPGLAEAPSYGQALERFALVEFLAGETAADRLPVAVHELAHVLSARTRPGTRARLQVAFADSGDAGLAAYALLEEGLAVAAGTIPTERALRPDSSMQRLLRTPLSLYNVPEVDRAGKALAPVAAEWLARGGTIAEGAFTARVLQALRAAFDTATDVRGLTAPRNLLHARTVFVDEALGDDAASVRHELATLFSAHYTLTVQDRCCSADAMSGYRTHARLPALFVVAEQSLPALVQAGVLPPDRSRGESPWLLVQPPAHPGPVFVVVARGAEEARVLLRQLATASSR